MKHSTLKFAAILSILFVAPSLRAQMDCHASFDYNQTANTLIINFSDLSTSGNAISSWFWDFADGNTSTEQNPSHAYDHPGLFGVCLTIQDNHGCHNTFCHHITVDSISQADCHALFDFEQVENTLTVNFSDLSSSPNTISSWDWDFGDGNTSSEQAPTHTYDHAGTYNVCLTIHDNHGCTSHYCHHFVVDPIPHEGCHALFNLFPTENELTIQFADSSSSSNTIISWLWNFGDGNESTDQNPAHTYEHAGTYEVCLTISDDHECSSTFCHHITIHHANGECHASYEFTPDTIGNGIQFTNTSTGTTAFTTYSWEFGDGETSTEENPHHTYIHSGDYTVCLFINDDSTGCASHFCHPVHIYHYGEGHHHQGQMVSGDHKMGPHDPHAGFGHLMTNYPNPFSVSTTLEYELAQPALVTIEVYNSFGKRLMLLSGAIEDKGIQTHVINADLLEPGLYFIRWSCDDETYMKTITVVK